MTNPISAAEVSPRAVRWLWRDRIPKGFITVVAGRPDQGKGLFSAHVAADVSRRGGKVLYSAVEDDSAMMTRPRLEAASANLDNIYLWRFALPAQQRELENIVVEHGISLIVMDPFAAHISGNVSRFSDTIRQILTPLTSLIEQTGTAVVVTEHALKRVSQNAHPLNAIGGSGSGLPAAARMGFAFGVDPSDGDRRVLAHLKSNLREPPKAVVFEVDIDEFPVVGEVPSLVMVEEAEFDARRLLTSNETPGKSGRRPDRRASAAEWLTNYLAAAAKPVKAGDVMEDAKQHGMTVRTLRKAADDMQVVRRPPGGGRNCTWQLPDAIREILGIEYEEVESDA